MSIASDLAAAFAEFERWMRENGAAVLADNLAPGATAARLAEAEAEIGFTLHPELRALWSIHDGQHEEQNGFVESYDLCSAQGSGWNEDLIEVLEEGAEDESELDDVERASTAWVRLASRDSNGLAVNCETGRVFEYLHDDLPHFRPVADSVVAWLRDYAASVAAGNFRLARGFGDVYLRTRDRAAEAREAARAAEEARRASLSTEARLAEAVTRQRPDTAGEALAAAADLDAAVALLFRQPASPAFLAEALRPFLRRITLEKGQWSLVAEGGARLGNRAIEDLARERGGL